MVVCTTVYFVLTYCSKVRFTPYWLSREFNANEFSVGLSRAQTQHPNHYQKIVWACVCARLYCDVEKKTWCLTPHQSKQSGCCIASLPAQEMKRNYSIWENISGCSAEAFPTVNTTGWQSAAFCTKQGGVEHFTYPPVTALHVVLRTLYWAAK